MMAVMLHCRAGDIGVYSAQTWTCVQHATAVSIDLLLFISLGMQLSE